ncbi:MAG: HAMP domain-containing histidine kinase [Burkholderiales bacterium]|nr:HAMP domain-containing histidine kinase [Burkholderiales bacterium]
MYTLRLRLITLFIAIVTLTLGLFGAYSQYQLARTLEAQFAQLQHGVLTRLQINLPEALWYLDDAIANSIIESEMLTEQVVAIRVVDHYGKLFSGKFRSKDNKILALAAGSKLEGRPVGLALVYSGDKGPGALKARGADTAVGQADIYFSRDHIAVTLRAELLRRVAEILMLDAVLVLALTLSLRTVFRPLAQLRDALFELASQNTEEARQLPMLKKNEFGEVIQGFNLIQGKLKQVLEKQRQAQQEAQQASAQTRLAYEELQKTQDILLQSEKLASLGGLVAGVAHEINTPVGITLTCASVLQDATDKLRLALGQGGLRKSDMLAYIDTASESARLITANAERAAHLINSFKQIAADQSSEVRRSYGLKTYLGEIIASLGPKLKRAGATIAVECEQEIQMDGYPGALAQIITNLTINSLTHAFPEGGGHITIDIQARGQRVSLRFQDDGCGIPAENMPHIFEPFFTTRRGQGCTGLGLNIVYNIITKQFGGSISVASEPGKGACFTLDLPCVAPQPGTG